MTPRKVRCKKLSLLLVLAVPVMIISFTKLQRLHTSSSAQSPTKTLDCPPLHYLSPPRPYLTALASTPGSGNTWLRHLLQEATRVHTGSIYNDTDLAVNGFPGEPTKNGSVLLVKTHREPKRKHFDKAVLLIRDPTDAYIAEKNRQHGGHTGLMPDSAYSNKRDWSARLKRVSLVWRVFNEDWLRLNESVHVVFYDELKRDVRFHLAGILTFLDFPHTYLDCAMIKSEGKFHRLQKTVDVTFLASDDNKRSIEKNKWQLYEEVYAHRRRFEH
ncbi:WSC domain-containing protein 2 [Lamellibrachia satsuma]|nr:WSC domain-containing protein 2 [Lamellibrachia satsuma]